MNKKSLYASAALLAMTYGCNSSYVKPVNLGQADNPPFETAKLSIQVDPDVFEVAPVEFTNDVSAGAAGADAATRSMAYSPNFHPAAALVGTVVGLQLVKATQESAAIDKANRPVALFQEQFREAWQTDKLAQLTTDYAYELATNGVDRCVEQCGLEIKVMSKALLTQDFRSALVVSHIKVLNQGRLLYENQIYHYSDSLAANTIADITKAWSATGYAVAIEEISSGISNTVSIAQRDMQQWLPKNQGNVAIRLHTDRGVYSDRGVVLADENSRITYKTLNGEIKSVSYRNWLSFSEYAKLMHPKATLPDSKNPPAEQN